MKTVSILIPVYNEINFIRRTLESVIGEADEILISDNASTDGTSEICDEFAKKYPEITYIRQKENIGGNKSYLCMLERASGKYMRLIGGHDMFSRGSTQRMVKLMEQNPDVIMVYPKNIMILNSDYSVADFVSISQYGDDLMSDSPFTRVESTQKYYYHDSIWYGLHTKESLMMVYNYAVFENLIGGPIFFFARYGKIMADNSVTSVFYRMIPGALRDTNSSLEDEGLRIYTKKVDPYASDFSMLCARYALVEEMQSIPGAPLDFAEKMFTLIANNLRFYGIPIFENIPNLLPEKKEFALYVYTKLLKKLGKSPKAPWERKNRLKNFIMNILPYGIISPQSILRLQSPRQEYFLYSNLFRLKWLVPYGLVRFVEKFSPPKKEHESMSLHGGKWW
jgi:glycosyltransferase involved in cell wall biosynthesis